MARGFHLMGSQSIILSGCISHPVIPNGTCNMHINDLADTLMYHIVYEVMVLGVCLQNNSRHIAKHHVCISEVPLS